MTNLNQINWHEIERLLNKGPEDGRACSMDESCPVSRKILANIGVSEPTINECIAHFHEHGGYCDCEVLMNALDGLIESQEQRLH